MPHKILLACVLLVAALPALAVPSPLAGAAVRIDNPAVPPLPPTEVPEGHAPLFTEGDLAPYLSEPAASAAQRLFSQGRYSEALSAFKKLKPNLATRYLSGLCLMHLGRDAEAAALFSALASESPALASRCHFHAAVSYEDAGQASAAEREYGAVEPGAVVWGEAQLGLARVRRERRDWMGVYDALAPLANRPSTGAGRDLQAEALIFIAQLARMTGDVETAKLADLRLWADHPLTKVSDVAFAEARALGVKDPGNALKLRRAEVLEEANRNEAALQLLKGLLNAWPMPEAEACKTHFLYGKALRKLRQHAAALDALDPVIAQCGNDPALRARALYVAGSSGSIVAPARGIAAYTTLAADYPDHAFADDALFFAADIQQKAGDLDAAKQTFKKLVDGPAYREGDFRAEGLFRLFWIARAQHQPESGLASLQRIINEYSATRVAEVERAEYWRARTLDELGRHTEADGALEALAKAHPTSYYALLARSRLAECHASRAQAVTQALSALPAPIGTRFQPGHLRDDAHFRAAVELQRMGLTDESADELLAISRERLRGEEVDALRLVVDLLARLGNGRAAQAIARTELASDLAGPLTPTSLEVWLAAYPLAFRPELQKSCSAAQVEPDLFQALIREESALDPHVVSWAGAVGLSQLMVPTAKSVARDLRIKGRIDLETLQQPELNLRLGSAYVGQLLRKFQGNPALALAAYNAGAGAVGRWLNDHGNDELDAFVEEIPIAETRAYVKRVLQTYNVYQLLYGRRAEAKLPRTPLPRKVGLKLGMADTPVTR